MPAPMTIVLVLAVAMRLGFFGFGLYQDATMPVKYTDIDYSVFSDAAAYVYRGASPYLRETYRYTPVLAWMLVPNSWGGWWCSFGKAVFMAADLVTGILIWRLLRLKTTDEWKTAVLSSLWLLNPMVVTISTRGSAESVLTVMIMLSLFFLYKDRDFLSAVNLGLAIHFKIYPVIYLPSVLLFLGGKPLVDLPVARLVNRRNLTYLVVTVATFASVSYAMYRIYGYEFVYHSYLYHFSRLDHRHNFSVYNVMLYYKSTLAAPGLLANVEKYAFVPQLGLAAVVLPLMFARRDLVSALFVQTFAFVTFNKVVTSQYFIWFLIFLPHYLAQSSLVKNKLRGATVLALWVSTQGAWLWFAYRLEFLGQNTFWQLLVASAAFYVANCWILGQFIRDLK